MAWLAQLGGLDPLLSRPGVQTGIWIALTWAVALVLLRVNGRLFDALDTRLTRFGVPERRLNKLDWISDVFLVVLASLVTLGLLGVGEALWGALALTSVAGVIVALAAQRLGQNLIAGMVILFERPFIVGDTIEVADRVGEVESVSLHTTAMTTPDGLQLMIPNQQVLDGSVKNFSVRPTRRLTIEIDVDVPNDQIDDARYAIRQAIQGEEHLVEDREIVVFAKTSLDEGVRFEARYWVQREAYGSHCLPTAMARILEHLEAEELATAMPTQKIYVAESPVST